MGIEPSKVDHRQELFGSSENNRSDRVYPTLHFADEDIGAYAKTHNLPYSSLYSQYFQRLDLFGIYSYGQDLCMY